MKTTVKYITNIITEQDIGKLVRIYSPNLQRFPYVSNPFYKIIAITGNGDVVLESCDDLRADFVRGKSLRDGSFSFEIHEELAFSEGSLTKMLDLVPFIPTNIWLGRNQYSSLVKEYGGSFNTFNFMGNNISIEPRIRNNQILFFDGELSE